MEIKKQIIIRTESHEEELRVADSIHQKLAGNPDYIESRIVLNTSADRQDSTENEVHIYVFPDSKTDIEFAVSGMANDEEQSEPTWAEKEVELACKREAPDRKDGEWDYGCACYESALKAYKNLSKDGHSGFSIGITKHILCRLIDHKPLTPIEDTPDIWSVISDFGDKVSYQCKRMSSLFKYVYADGTVEYSDVDRCIGIDVVTNTSWHMGLADRIIDEMFPVTMPYDPSDRPFRVFCEEFLTDKKNGDYDTVGILHVIKPDGERIEINRYFKDAEVGFDEIDKAEYEARKEIKIG